MAEERAARSTSGGGGAGRDVSNTNPAAIGITNIVQKVRANRGISMKEPLPRPLKSRSPSSLRPFQCWKVFARQAPDYAQRTFRTEPQSPKEETQSHHSKALAHFAGERSTPAKPCDQGEGGRVASCGGPPHTHSLTPSRGQAEGRRGSKEATASRVRVAGSKRCAGAVQHRVRVGFSYSMALF